MTQGAWLEPWCAPLPGQASILEQQLAREVCPQHVLHGQPVHLLALRRDCDDVLFALDGGEVAEVHLTWYRTMETDPRWPRTAVFASLDAWVRQSMMSSHLDWTGQGTPG